MLGYPGEDIQDIRDTIKYLKEANPTKYTITVAYPIKGTALYDEIESKITKQPDWETSTDREIDFQRTYSRKFYDFALRHVTNEVNSSRTNSFKQKIIYKLKSTVHFLFMVLIAKKYG